MSRVYSRPGYIMDYLNSTGADLPVGSVVVAGVRVGVCEVAIPNGTVGSVRVREVVNLPKKAGDTPAQGGLVYWDAVHGYITTTSAGNTLAGYAFGVAAAGDALLEVNLNA